jgi:glucose/mannose-6-phosphate isomerase
MMNSLIERFPNQLKEALEIGQASTIKTHIHEVNKIYIAGMGGSGIGGDFVAQFVSDECKVPIIVGKKYRTPAYIDKNTLVIISSYSGNTEETIYALNSIQHSGAKIVCIASGGKSIALAKQYGYDFIQLPGDWPSPRACLGYSIVAQLFVLRKLDMIGSRIFDQIKSASELLKYDQDDIKEKAKKIAQAFHKKTPVIYIEDRLEAVALRFRQQICENAKQLCWHNVIPEMNHNELVGWKDNRDDLTILFLRNKDDFKRNNIRMDINIKIISGLCNTVMEVQSKGQSMVENALYFVHLGDWVSWYLSQLRGVDAIEIDVIDFLKKELGKV